MSIPVPAGQFIPLCPYKGCRKEISRLVWNVNETPNGRTALVTFMCPHCRAIINAQLCPIEWWRPGGSAEPAESRRIIEVGPQIIPVGRA